MSDDTPKGKELEFIKECKNKIGKLEKIQSSLKLSIFSMTDASISVGHALKGVRTNGIERINTLKNVMERLPGLLPIDHINNELLKAKNIINELNKKYNDNFIICPECKGEKGAFFKARMILNNFSDCDNCEGRGIVLRER